MNFEQVMTPSGRNAFHENTEEGVMRLVDLSCLTGEQIDKMVDGMKPLGLSRKSNHIENQAFLDVLAEQRLRKKDMAR